MSKLFRKVDSEDVYRGKIINVRVDTVRYRDKILKWEIVDQGNAAVIMPLIEKDTFLMIHQYRYTTGKYIWEFPAGRTERDESLEECVQRELEEECGYRAKHIKPLLSYYPSPGVSTEKMNLFFATDLYKTQNLRPDLDEIIRPKPLPIDKIEDMIKQGEIEDAKTILSFYHYKLYKKSIL